MLFQLAMTIIRGIVDPDNFIDGKNNGGGLIYRILISLTLFSLLIPINTSKSNEYERQINNNGILFGTLYSLQNRILLNNTLGKLVLGTTDGGTYMDTGTNANNMQIAAKRFTTTVVKGFYRVNLLPDKEDPSIVSSRVCQDADSSKMIRSYQSESVDAGDVISLVNETCITDEANWTAYLWKIGDITGNKKYVFAYTPFIPAIVGAVFVFLIISLTIDIAVRAVKLVILRMIAPIPIISYMDPKGSKDGAFNAWVKSLTGTYLDLFIRLATMYFILFIIQEMIVNGVVINNNRGAVGLLSVIFIWIGLFVFAKEAPKFIREALGLKGDGGKLFGGLGNILSAGAVGLGVVGGAASGAIAGAANSENKFFGFTTGGIKGAVGGGMNAGKAFWNAKEPNSGDIMNKVRAYNRKNYTNAEDESTSFGRFIAGLQSDVGLKNQYQHMEDKIGDYNAATAAWKRINTALDSDDNKFTYTGPSVVDSRTGQVLFASGTNYSVKGAKDILERMKTSGQYTATDIEAMEDAHKAMQNAKFDDVRQRGAAGADLKGTEAQIFQAQKTIHTIGLKYANDKDEVFKDFAGTAVNSTSLNMGKHFKGATYNADRSAEALKSSAEYATAKANAQRAEQDKK